MTEEEKDILMRMGVALLLVQQVEEILRTCLTLVLQDGAPLTVEKLLAREKTKATLGQFLNELRQKADLYEGFDKLLSNFLENRNTLVQKITNVKGWSLQTENGRKTAAAFVNTVINQANKITNVLTALIVTWHENSGLGGSIPDEVRALSKDYVPFIDHIFFAKE